MEKKLVIDPITRVEGHGKVTIHLDEAGQVDKAYLHIVEFRGFERFIQGHPYWEAPVLVQRLCGICPVSHHLAAAKAIDQLVGIDPSDLSPTAEKLRRLLHYAQVFQSHALHFFYLASPDLLFGMDADPARRNSVGVAMADRELARKGILMRKFGQELIKAIAGKKIHGIAAVPGGIHKVLTTTERDRFLQGNGIPSIDAMIQWSQEVIQFVKNFHYKNAAWIDQFAQFPSGHMGLVGENGEFELYHGRLRAIDGEGRITLNDVPNDQYHRYIAEGVEKWSYMKFPYLKHLGRETGWNRVGPLARINLTSKIPTPLAEWERQIFMAHSPGWPNHSTMFYHWARIIELLHCAEVMKKLLNDPDILGGELRREGEHRTEGIGIIEAPRGTLVHHYQVDAKGQITKCNLIVSTTYNNEAMNEAVRWVARNELAGKDHISEGMLNRVETAIRAYDPCLSCATHAIGQMPLQLQLFGPNGEILDEYAKW